MPDMLVKLYDLALSLDFVAEMTAKGVTIRKPIGPEKHKVTQWVRGQFGPGWGSEFDMTMSNAGVTSFIATLDGKVVGFACYNGTVPGFFGPTGVAEEHRGKGIGRALLLACLVDMKLAGYAYAIIGGAGPTAFYEKACGAVEIAGSAPGVYKGMIDLKEDETDAKPQANRKH